jgi:hypothetical protein
MQCMMKEICAQPAAAQGPDRQDELRVLVLQPDQRSTADFGALDQRLRQNSVQEKFTAQWIAFCEHDRS